MTSKAKKENEERVEKGKRVVKRLFEYTYFTYYNYSCVFRKSNFLQLYEKEKSWTH